MKPHLSSEKISYLQDNCRTGSRSLVVLSASFLFPNTKWERKEKRKVPEAQFAGSPCRGQRDAFAASEEPYRPSSSCCKVSRLRHCPRTQRKTENASAREDVPEDA